MKISSQNKLLVSLESAALTDIIMNLFIFFFVSFSLLYTFNKHKESDIKVNLPRGTVTAEQYKGPLVVSITKENAVYLDSEKVELKDLAAALRREMNKAKKEGVVIKSDKEASVDTLVKVLDTSKSIGIGRLGIAIEVPKTPGAVQQ